MIKTTDFNSYLKFLHSFDRTEYSQLDEYDRESLTAYKIRETEIESLPRLEDFDKNREIMILLSKWIEDNSNVTAIEILERLRECAVQAFKPTIESEMKTYEPEYDPSEYDEYRSATSYLRR